jgi:glycosyltransferase involved in cell wall biosynthesis
MKNPLKICFVQPIQSPYWTDRLKVLAGYLDLELSLLLDRAAFVHRPGWKPEPINGVQIDIIRSSVFRSTSYGDDLGYRIDGIRSIPWRLVAELWRIRPDVVVVCNATQLFFSLPSKWIFGVRLALIVEDTPHATRNLSAINRKLKTILYRRADRWFAFSEDAKLLLKQMGIQEGVLKSSWSLDMSKFRPKLFLKEVSQGKDARSACTVLFVGQLIPRKGVMLLLESWCSLPLECREGARLLIVGDGPLRQEINTFLDKSGMYNVQTLGQRPYAEVRDLMSQANLFVLPTLEDLFSLTVVEAMACACPVITTPFAGARELVAEGENGWVVDPTQPGALAAALAKAFSSQSNLDEMGRKARERIEHLDNALVMDEFAQALRELALSSQ